MGAIRKLEDVGAIIVTRRNGASNRYSLGQLSLLPVAPCDRSREPTGEPEPVKRLDRSSEQTGQAIGPEPVKLLDSTGQATGPEGIQEGIQEGTQMEAAVQTSAPEVPKLKPPRKRSEQPRVPRWRRVPDGFQPTTAHQALAATLGVNLDVELAKFRDHEYRDPKSDADAAFRTWLRNAATFNSGSRARSQVQSGGQIRETKRF